MSDYAAIVERDSFAHRIVHVGDKPYWSTNNADGTLCFVSVRRGPHLRDLLREREGDRERPGRRPPPAHADGRLPPDLLPGDRVAPRLSRLKVVRRGRGRLRLRASEAVRLAIDARKVRRDGRRTRRVQTVRRRVRAGTSRVGLGRLSAGSYR